MSKYGPDTLFIKVLKRSGHLYRCLKKKSETNRREERVRRFEIVSLIRVSREVTQCMRGEVYLDLSQCMVPRSPSIELLCRGNNVEHDPCLFSEVNENVKDRVIFGTSYYLIQCI